MNDSCTGRLVIIVVAIFLICLGGVGDVILLILAGAYFILWGKRNL